MPQCVPPIQSETAVCIAISGVVQGVGFRPWVARLAAQHGVLGRVFNSPAGVTIEAFASAAVLQAFLHDIVMQPPSAARIDALSWSAIADLGSSGFAIAASESAGSSRLAIPADLATCDDCLVETLAPQGRRAGYAFTSCTACGPRLTVTLATPFDRHTTTMAGFALCPECAREYADLGDRRFHAQTLACPVCGPQLSLDEGDAPVAVPDPLARAAEHLRAGAIVAVQGLGGWHLACDATAAAAVQRLRQRKLRDHKAFAVLVADLKAARALATVSAAEAAALTSTQRPIVLCRAKPGLLAAEVAPDSTQVGLLLAYTPLHSLLARAVGRPLVLTSGNASREPMAVTRAEAANMLGHIADARLGHNRPIALRCDDSVVRVIHEQPVLLRRSRGWVPQAIRLAKPLRQPVLAVGAQQRSVFCLAAGDEAWLGPHIGDLDEPATLESFMSALEHMQRLLGIRPALVAHDLHPDYASTRLAKALPGVTTVAVQHHHAHIAAAMAELHLPGPVLGIAYDGTGLGTDGAAWGGELLLTWPDRFLRLATLRPLRLAGGDQAIVQPWRVALALVDDALGPTASLDGLALFDAVPVPQREAVRKLLQSRSHAPLAHGAGRYFDGFAALGLPWAHRAEDGELALRWEQLAAAGPCAPWPFALDQSSSPWQLDLRPAVRTAVAELREGAPVSQLAARFHQTLVDATVCAVQAARLRYGSLPVVLTGGCMQNARLAEGLFAQLGADVWQHRSVPPGDGGLCLGQVLVADASAP